MGSVPTKIRTIKMTWPPEKRGNPMATGKKGNPMVTRKKGNPMASRNEIANNVKRKRSSVNG